MDCDLHYLGLTIYIMYSFWVSLGWFYLLDIHCDYSLISPFRSVTQTPDCGMLVVHLSFISPLCGVAPTPDCGIIISAFSARGVIQTLVWHQYYYSAFSARGVIQTLVWHPVFCFGIFLTICVHLGLSYISWQTCDHLINPEHVWYIIPVFLMFASTFKRTHWLVPGYCLGQIALRGGMHRGDTLGAYVLTCAASRR